MVSRNVIIAIVILILVALGFYFLSNMTGNVITGSVINEPDVENEYFKIDENDNFMEVVNDTQNNDRSG